jgi:ABC-2 family transporter protein
MNRLLRAEVRRIATRRVVRVTALLAALAIVLGGILAFARTGSLSETTYQQRVRAAAVQQDAQNAATRACLQAHGVKAGDNYSRAVANACFPDAPIAAHDPRFHRARLQDLLKGVSGVLAIIGWALGASFVGAEFASRSMTTLLTWETRRTRVIVAKAIVAAFAAVTLIAMVLALLPTIVVHGAPLRAGDPGVATLIGVIARGTALAALAAGMGFGIATIGRNTAAALGAGFAYIIVLENILGNSLRQRRRWLLLGNAIVFVSGHSGAADVPGRSVIGAGMLLAAVAGALLIGAAAAFRARDVA